MPLLRRALFALILLAACDDTGGLLVVESADAASDAADASEE